MLHIVNKSPTQTNALASCLRLAADGNAVLLIEDAVYAANPAVAERCGLAAAAGRLKVYVLQPDVEARGLSGKTLDGVQAVDYAGFVGLVAEHPRNQSWL